jgi:hypothetical protein
LPPVFALAFRGRESLQARPDLGRGVAIFRVAYWTTVSLAPLVALALTPSSSWRVLFNDMTFLFYVIAAAALYRLLLRIAWDVSGSDSVEKELEDSEGRVELHLGDDRHGR